MTDLSHLNALNLRLSHERARLASAKAGEKAQRQVWIAQIEREIANERAFLGLTDASQGVEMSDDDLLAALGA